MVSINVLIITYNQQNIIGRALDSILCQKEWGLKEIVICDDHSTDNNWEVIQSYVSKYPDIIRAYRNDSNLGIYGNVERTYELRGDADLYVSLSGDDSFNSEYFKHVQDLVVEQKVNLSQPEIILFDYQEILSNGKVLNISNKGIKKTNDYFRLKYRFIVNTRGMLVTNSIMNHYKPVDLEKGVSYAEECSDVQPFMYARKAYHCKYPANTYYAGIGVSSKMKTDYYRKLRLKKWKLFLSQFDLCPKDVFYTKMRINLAEYEIKPSFKSLLRVIYYFIKGLDSKIGISKLQFIFALRMIVTRPFKK